MFPSKIIYEYIISNRGSMSGETKKEFARTGLILGLIFGGGALFYLFKVVLHVPFKYVLIGVAVIAVGILIFVFRFVVFDEDAKTAEYNDRSNDSFSRFLHMRSDIQHEFKLGKKTSAIFEKTDGKPFVVLEFSFGSNDEAKSKITEKLFQNILQKFIDNNFLIQLSVLSERFEENENYQRYLRSLNQIEDNVLQSAALSIAEAVLEQVVQSCNVSQVYITLTSPGMSSLYDMQIMLPQIINEVNSSRSAIRECKILNMEETLEFYKRYYHIPVIDRSLLQSSNILEKFDSYKDVCSIVSLKGTNKTYDRTNDYLVKHGIGGK